MSDTVLVSNPTRGVTLLTLNRPEKLNAMNVDLISELHDALSNVAADRSCRAVVLTGAGRGFCAGLDLKGYGTVPGSEGRGQAVGSFATQQHIASLIPQLRASIRLAAVARIALPSLVYRSSACTPSMAARLIAMMIPMQTCWRSEACGSATSSERHSLPLV